MIYRPLFSIVTVVLNSVDAALFTAQSVLSQHYLDYEYIIKDGGSQDGTVEQLRNRGLIVYVKPDRGIYDAMNQALAYCQGEYVYFLNAGDTFYDDGVLGRVAAHIDMNAAVVYGDVMQHPYSLSTNYPTRLSRYYLFRKNLCHQAWMVRRDVYRRLGGFRADSPVKPEQQAIVSDQEFLWRALLQQRLPAQKIPVLLANFEYGGYSTRQDMRTRSMDERWALLRMYFSRQELFLYGLRSLYFLNPIKVKVWNMIHQPDSANGSRSNAATKIS
ncbi:glycosyltransferase [Candidatus Chloroploca sp. M-50]|uniref:Glycosyltransferase n=1 Tax=Candidatus Chloroploca mongolica TaxID=2528176 RepID=A0ABS4D8H4_9CHLR|nr:glycosyltransferase family 2 protein [Candidatus Chloroploca mongolica]MBP1465737.1 glycosyltransferase [Candidatus Chloroploca mongolica]